MDKVETPKKVTRGVTRRKRNKQPTESKKLRRSKRMPFGPAQPSVSDNSFRYTVSDIVEIFRNEMAKDSRKNSLKSIFQVT